MIIIKSQDGKKIFEVKGLLLTVTPKSYGIDIPYRIVEDEGASLGYYSTEERAKEVMDMIENHIKNNYIFKAICQISSVEYPTITFTELYDNMTEHKTNAIFTMPKE